MSTEKRSVITLSLSPEEKAALKVIAESYGYNQTAFVRAIALGYLKISREG